MKGHADKPALDGINPIIVPAASRGEYQLNVFIKRLDPYFKRSIESTAHQVYHLSPLP